MFSKIYPMADQYISIDNLKFQLFDVHQIDQLTKHEYYADFDKESLGFLIDSSKDFAEKMLFPFFEEMDRDGVTFENGNVTAHPHIYKILQELGQSGWTIGTLSKAEGGMQLPHAIHNATEMVYYAANNSAVGHVALTAGAAKLISAFGTERLKRQYADKMYAGDWQGTMAMTEPQAGSSISDISTSATPQTDGTYRINGQKIFISGGDYTDTPNVVHLMLARIDGAPSGIKGVSLFVVPKKRVADDGNLSDNDVITAGVFHKMGQHAYVTTHLMMGEKNACTGYLVGEKNMGMSYMFQMMNGARIGVGAIGAAIASAAYYSSLQYAQERTQGRNPSSKDPNEEPIKIINHADVRRMLFHQKAIVEGSISLIVECSKYQDLINVTSGKEKENNELMLDILTPVVKTYPTEKGIESVNNGMQVLGGYGYCKDFPLEQLARDIRITTLYEGTTGIQSLDLLGRKMVMQDGKAAQLLFGEILKSIQTAQSFDDLKAVAKALGASVQDFQKVMTHLLAYAKKGQVELFLKDANLFMELSGHIIIGWQWLKQGTTASEMLQQSKGDAIFLESKLETMNYFYAYELPKTKSLMATLMDGNVITMPGEKELLI